MRDFVGIGQNLSPFFLLKVNVMKKTLITVLLLCASCTAIASEWIGPYTIDNIEMSSGLIYFSGAGFATSFSACPNPKGVVYIRDVVVDGFSHNSDIELNRILSLGLTAKIAANKVKFYVYECADVNYVKARSIGVF